MNKKKVAALAAGMLIVGFIGGQAFPIKSNSNVAVMASKDTQDNANSDEDENENENEGEGATKEELLEEDMALKETIEGKKSELDKKVYEELIALVDNLIKADEEEDSDKSNEIYSELEEKMGAVGIYIGEGSDNVIRKYEVVDGEIGAFQKKSERVNVHKLLWDRAKHIFPQKYDEIIKSFVVESDGYQNTLASVAPITEENKNYTLTIDIADGFDKNGNLGGREFDYTLVHELGHIVTLNNTQLDAYDENTETYLIDEGATKEESYLNQFYQKFWKKHEETLKKIEAAKAEGEESEEARELSGEFYDNNKEEFLTEYASSNPVEDIAETFAEFVYTDEPKGDSVVDQKIKFFYGYEELVKLREELRENLELNK